MSPHRDLGRHDPLGAGHWADATVGQPPGSLLDSRGRFEEQRRNRGFCDCTVWRRQVCLHGASYSVLVGQYGLAALHTLVYFVHGTPYQLLSRPGKMKIAVGPRAGSALAPTNPTWSIGVIFPLHPPNSLVDLTHWAELQACHPPQPPRSVKRRTPILQKNVALALV